MAVAQLDNYHGTTHNNFDRSQALLNVKIIIHRSILWINHVGYDYQFGDLYLENMSGTRSK